MFKYGCLTTLKNKKICRHFKELSQTKEMNEMHFLTKGKDAFIYYSLDDVCTYTCTLFMKYEEIKQIDLNEYAIFVISFLF